jgi:hypothetical protein
MSRLPMFALLAFACSGPAAAQPPTLAGLAEGDRVEIAYRSRGCFFYHAFDAAIRREDRYLARLSSDRLRHPIDVELSADDVAALDELLAHFRAQLEPRRCTTVLRADLTWTQVGATWPREAFEDWSCRAPDAGKAVMNALMTQVSEHAVPAPSRRLAAAVAPETMHADCPAQEEAAETGGLSPLEGD